MPEFHSPVIEDKEKVDLIRSKSGYEGSFYSFMTMYTWAKEYNTRIAFYKDALLVSGCSETMGHYFLYPIGEYDLEEVLGIMKAEAEKNNYPLKIVAEKWQAEELYSRFSDAFEVSDSRDDWDYVYNTEELAFLKGNRYHNKRNHISRFTRKFGESAITFEPLCAENIAQCMEIEYAWIESKGTDFDLASVVKALDDFEALEAEGGILKIDDKPIAFTVGEALTEDTFLIHIEKSLPGYDGAYQLINQMFAKTLVGRFEYINREEDMGIEGLRSAKLSYLPCKFIEKCVITERK